MLDHAFQRRREIERMLLSGKRLTVPKLMAMYSVGKNAIRRDFEVIGEELPVIAKQGYNGGVFITDNYKPYTNTLTETELETLCRLYGKAEGKEKEILFRIIHKYGADKLEI
jgi:predicted DNA-binding transcriptional regulator YafY